MIYHVRRPEAQSAQSLITGEFGTRSDVTRAIVPQPRTQSAQPSRRHRGERLGFLRQRLVVTISTMFGGFGRKAAESQAAQQPEPEPEGLARMVADEDMAAEAASLDQAMAALAVGGGGAPGAAAGLGAVPAAAASSPLRSVPLNWARNTGGHKASADTLRLLCEAGGAEGVQAFTNSFYTKAFADPVLDRLIREHDDPHGARFAAWITEKFGDGTPWTDERRTRKTCPFVSTDPTRLTKKPTSVGLFWAEPDPF